MMDAMEKALNSSRLRTEPSFILLYWKVVKHRLYEICSFSESNDREIRIIRALKFYLDGAFFTHLSNHSKNVRCHNTPFCGFNHGSIESSHCLISQNTVVFFSMNTEDRRIPFLHE